MLWATLSVPAVAYIYDFPADVDSFRPVYLMYRLF